MMIGMDDVDDFLRQMAIAVLEESPLCEIPLGSFTLGDPVVHGPWPAASCAAVLRIWFEADWIGLYFRDQPEWGLIRSDWRTRLVDSDTLAGPDARELLDHPERWVRERADGYVMLFMTWQGEVATEQEWIAAAADTAQPLSLAGPGTLPPVGPGQAGPIERAVSGEPSAPSRS
jgi:hypothetical protein